MNHKVEQALNRLNTILPLKANQDDCAPEIKQLHQHILRSFVENGRSLTKAEIAREVADVENAINTLHSKDMVVFDCAGEPLGAYPFTTETREHKVQVNGHQLYAMCSLDALAISPMFGTQTIINSQCRVTGAPIIIQQSNHRIENQDAVGDVHVGIAWNAANGTSSCATTLCMEMIFLRDTTTAQTWQAEDATNREIFTLEESILFAEHFFLPLLN